MDKIGEALVQLVKSGVPAASHVATLYFVWYVFTDILTVMTIGGIVYTLYYLLKRWMDYEYNYNPTICKYCSHDPKTGDYIRS